MSNEKHSKSIDRKMTKHKIPVPKEVRYFANLPILDYLCDESDVSSIIALHIRFTEPAALPIVDSYIAALLNSGLTEEEIDNVWGELATEYYIVRGHTTSFLKKVREQIAALSADKS